MPLPFSNKYAQADLKALQQVLQPMFAERINGPSAQIQLLNIACGRADETGILAKILSQYTNCVEITGVDIRSKEIHEANMRWKPLPTASCQFMVHDGSQLDQAKELDGPYDIVFMRHQNYWNGAETWHRIYDQALHRVKPNGIFAITSYFDREHHQALQAISALGGHLLISSKNPFSRPLNDAPNKSVDRHIAFFSTTPPVLSTMKHFDL